MEYKEESLNNLLRLQELWWQVDASCQDQDPDLFFPNRGASTRKAKEMEGMYEQTTNSIQEVDE